MIITPILTEKSLTLAKSGVYSFRIERKFTKYQIKELVQKMFAVHPVNVMTMNYKSTTRRTNRGKSVTVSRFKKALVEVKKGETISIFMGSTKTKAKGKTA